MNTERRLEMRIKDKTGKNFSVWLPHDGDLASLIARCNEENAWRTSTVCIPLVNGKPYEMEVA